LGNKRCAAAAVATVLALAGGWLAWTHIPASSSPSVAASAPLSVTSDTCFKCHEAHYESWHRTYHRTMTREARPEFIKGDYHIVEKRWVHTNGAFLSPDTDDFWNKSSVWNESCVFCHNTKPSKQPQRQPWDENRVVGYATDVAELGIACEACHGPGAEHVRVNQNL